MPNRGLEEFFRTMKMVQALEALWHANRYVTIADKVPTLCEWTERGGSLSKSKRNQIINHQK